MITVNLSQRAECVVASVVCFLHTQDCLGSSGSRRPPNILSAIRENSPVSKTNLAIHVLAPLETRHCSTRLRRHTPDLHQSTPASSSNTSNPTARIQFASHTPCEHTNPPH